MRELSWRKGDPDGCLDLDLSGKWVTMDPGSVGVALAFRPLAEWKDGNPRPVVMGAVMGRRGATRFAARANAVSLAFTEEPFVGRENVQSALVTARSAGFFQGALASAVELAGGELTIVTLPAQSWQAKVIPRSLGDRDERKKAMVDWAETIMGDDVRWTESNKALKGAIADALGMAKWWAMLRRPELYS